MPVRRRPLYETSIDRVGLAIAAGGAMGGVIAAVLLAFAGDYGVGALASGLAIGAVLTALGITALAIVPWALLHAGGRRGPGSAALVGATIGFMLFLGGQTYGFGLAHAPVMGGGTWLYRWASAIATSLVMAAMTAGVAVVMWRIAYRRAA